jgi:hypothetical protein
MLKYVHKLKKTLSKFERLRRYLPEKFETLTGITHLLIIKYILKLAGICCFCKVNDVRNNKVTRE